LISYEKIGCCGKEREGAKGGWIETVLASHGLGKALATYGEETEKQVLGVGGPAEKLKVEGKEEEEERKEEEEEDEDEKGFGKVDGEEATWLKSNDKGEKEGFVFTAADACENKFPSTRLGLSFFSPANFFKSVMWRSSSVEGLETLTRENDSEAAPVSESESERERSRNPNS